MRRKGVATSFMTLCNQTGRVAKPSHHVHVDHFSRSAPLLHLSMFYLHDESIHVETTLRAYATYIRQWSERETPWKTASSVMPMACRKEKNSILQNVSIAFDHFRKNRSVEGGEILRKAFLQIEDAIVTGLDIEAIWDCCLAVPQLALSLGWLDILRMFTKYLWELTTVRAVGHPIALIAENIHRLAMNNPQHLRTYVERGWQLWVNLIGQIRGDHDHVTIHLKRGYVILMHPDQSIVSRFVSDFDKCVQKSLNQHGPEETTGQIMDLELLLVRMYIPLFSLESSLRAERMLSGLLARVENKACNLGVPVNEWNYLDRYLFFSALHFLASIADHNGEREKAVNYRRKSLRSPKDHFWMQTALRLEDYLRSEGRHEEADEILGEMEDPQSPNFEHLGYN